MRRQKEKEYEDIICEKIDKEEKICIICRDYLEHRIPEQVREYGKNTGTCLFDDETEGKSKKIADMTGLIIIKADSTCEHFESIFPGGNKKVR